MLLRGLKKLPQFTKTIRGTNEGSTGIAEFSGGCLGRLGFIGDAAMELSSLVSTGLTDF